MHADVWRACSRRVYQPRLEQCAHSVAVQLDALPVGQAEGAVIVQHGVHTCGDIQMSCELV